MPISEEFGCDGVAEAEEVMVTGDMPGRSERAGVPRLRVAAIAAECEPWAKTGGLADVVDALARAVGRVPGGPTSPVDVYLPRYRGVKVRPDQVVGRTTVRLPDTRRDARTGEAIDVTILDVAGDGYRVRLADCPEAFDRDGFYGPPGGDHPDNAWRFALLCRAALEAIRLDGGVDVIHLHDWQAAPAALLRTILVHRDPALAGTAMVLTLHNVAYQGWVPPERLAELGPELRRLVPPEGTVLLRDAIAASEIVNTVSPGFADQVRTAEHGMDLDPLLRSLGDRFSGILNGIDPEVWNPATDAELAAGYERSDRTGKLECRADLLQALGFDPEDPGAVLAMIGRLDRQKGFDVLAGAANRLLDLGARLVVLGSGDPTLADPFRLLAAAHPGRLALIEGFDRGLARRVYAGADMFLMPSRFEPCGQGQMIALRYGTPPVVRRTGGLADTVIDVTANPSTGTGFVFDDASPEALVEACERALVLRGTDADAWEALVGRAMAADFDWQHGSAAAYVAAYRRAMTLRRSARDPALRDAPHPA